MNFQFNQKHMALFLAAIMLMSVFSFFLSSLLGNGNNGAESTDMPDAPGFDSIPGTHADAALNSIEDGLKITPVGVTSASYIDYSKVYGTPLQVLAPNFTEMYSAYNAVILKRYSAYNSSGDFAFEGHVISPETINFQYMITDQPYNGYYLLARNEQFYNIVGNPMLFGGQESLKKVIDTNSGNSPASEEFEDILSYVEPGAQYQMVSSDDVTAEQHYIEFRDLEDGMYARTEVLLEPADNVLESIETKQASSPDRGLSYEVTVDGDVMVVEITTDAENFYNLAIEQLM